MNLMQKKGEIANRAPRLEPDINGFNVIYMNNKIPSQHPTTGERL